MKLAVVPVWTFFGMGLCGWFNQARKILFATHYFELTELGSEAGTIMWRRKSLTATWFYCTKRSCKSKSWFTSCEISWYSVIKEAQKRLRILEKQQQHKLVFKMICLQL